MKVLFLTQTSNIGASARYRVYQYVPFLEDFGIECTIIPAVSDDIYRNYHKTLCFFSKTSYYGNIIIRRIFDILQIKKFDAVFLQRDMVIHLYPFLEKCARIFNNNIIFDFDDAIHLIPSNKKPNLLLDLLWDKKKIEKIIKLSKHVIVGNPILEKYARNFNNNVTIVPTSVDLNLYKVNKTRTVSKDRAVKIGWIGSQGTFSYLKNIIPVFMELNKKYNICINVIGAWGPEYKGLAIKYQEWNLDTELNDLYELDIGVMPLSNDEWSKGKSATKLLQYLAAGIPAVCSPVGVNSEIIKDGLNGFLADTQEEWGRKISLLIENNSLFNRVSSNARSSIERFYSVQSNAPILAEIIKTVAKNK